jgi:hypothetical protein
VEKEVPYGFENALNYSRDDFHEDGHATTLRLIGRHALFIPLGFQINIAGGYLSVAYIPG